MNENKCNYCGKYLPNSTFYTIQREAGELRVWICPYCKHRVSMWVKK